MKKGFSRFACAALCAASCIGSSAMADNSTNELVQAKSPADLPSIEASAFYKSMKIERGMVENKDSVFGYEVELEWHGFFLGVEGCYDMTNTHVKMVPFVDLYDQFTSAGRHEYRKGFAAVGGVKLAAEF